MSPPCPRRGSPLRHRAPRAPEVTPRHLTVIELQQIPVSQSEMPELKPKLRARRLRSRSLGSFASSEEQKLVKIFFVTLHNVFC